MGAHIDEHRVATQAPGRNRSSATGARLLHHHHRYKQFGRPGRNHKESKTALIVDNGKIYISLRRLVGIFLCIAHAVVKKRPVGRVRQMQLPETDITPDPVPQNFGVISTGSSRCFGLHVLRLLRLGRRDERTPIVVDARAYGAGDKA
jgi:hypothetical protein